LLSRLLFSQQKFVVINCMLNISEIFGGFFIFVIRFMLKILCLHGHGQCSMYFTQKLGALRNEVKKLCVMSVPDAPFPCPTEDVPDARSWYSFTRLESGQTDRYDNFEDAVAFLAEYDRAQGPFDGILSFSQGTVVSVVLAARANEKLFPSLKFCVMFSGLLPSDKYLRADTMALLREKTVSSLHIFGTEDKVITPDRSLELAMAFGPTAQVVSHDGGHFVPSSVRKQLKEFVSQFVLRT